MEIKMSSEKSNKRLQRDPFISKKNFAKVIELHIKKIYKQLKFHEI